MPLETSIATSDHDTEKCPVCEYGFAAGEIIRTCKTCGTVHHVLCWDTVSECRECHPTFPDPENATERPTEILISVREVRNAPDPPKNFPIRTPEELAAEFAKRSGPVGVWLAAGAAVISALSLSTIFGLAINRQGLVAIGCFFAFLGIFMGIVAAIVWRPRYRSARIAAGVVAVPCSVIIMAGFWTIHNRADRVQPTIAPSDIRGSRPLDDRLDSLPRPIASALRANVVIVAGEFLGQTYGSGVITRVASDQVYILTNKHVIGRSEPNVYFQNGQSSVAKIEWLAPEGVDLVFITCVAEHGASYTAVPVYCCLANAGAPTFAVGNPDLLPWTYTQGVVSSLRTSQFADVTLEVYQTQTPINPGNSGGGLYSDKGTLIGINTWKRNDADSEGIGFSISTQSLLALLHADEIRTLIEEVKR